MPLPPEDFKADVPGCCGVVFINRRLIHVPAGGPRLAQPELATGASEATSTRVILVGVGGASCSGKTTLAKHLNRIIPDSVIIHQDDFAPPEDKLVVHPVYQVQDWDAAPGAIDWPRLVAFLREVKFTGKIPPDHRSHDHLNEQKDIPIGDDVEGRWRDLFEKMKRGREERKGEKVIWGLVDGFLLYWDRDVIDQLDVRLFLRVPHDVLKQRRHERHGYHTAAQFDAIEGTLWRDPPYYWDQIVYPAYVEAHRDIFQDGDVEHGKPFLDGGNVKVMGLILIEGMEMEMGQVVELCCEKIAQVP